MALGYKKLFTQNDIVMLHTFIFISLLKMVRLQVHFPGPYLQVQIGEINAFSTWKLGSYARLQKLGTPIFNGL